MRNKKLVKSTLLCVVFFNLISCGGGGGKSTPNAPPVETQSNNWDQLEWDQGDWG